MLDEIFSSLDIIPRALDEIFRPLDEIFWPLDCGLPPLETGWEAILNRLGNQVVVRVADDFDLGEFANGQFAADVNAAVNVRRVGFAAAHQKVTGDG